ncbi:ATP-binding response regulator [Chitinophaga vietnamensis]|uniref:ATP-binding response regulator n=1 Tax=Chitinophaga vietnamensis TaxID=2593957 RepID=UPI0011777EC7|nr:response regulator [Chitinophaga vietnamensis]
MNVNAVFKSIRETGAAQVNDEDKKRIVLVNTLSFFTGFFALTLGPLLAVITRQILILYPALIEGISFMFVIYLNSRRLHREASLVMLIIQNLSALYFGLIFGGIAASALELLMLCLVSASLLIFRDLKIRVFTITIAIVCVYIFEYNFYHQVFTPLDFSIENQYLIRWLAVGVIFFLNLVVIVHYAKQTDKTKDLETANVYKTLFLQETSHEIRSPLDAIFGISQLLMMQLEKAKEKGQVEVQAIMPLAEHLYAASYSVRGIINNILDLAKIQKGKYDEISKEHINLAEWLQDIINTHTYNAKRKAVAITLEVAPDMPAIIVTDAVKLNQIVNNLLSNAIKFTPQKSTISVRVLREANTWRLKIKDQGTGISAEMRHKIFDPFVFKKVDFFESTGLGLSIAKRFAELLQGELSLEESGRNGSVFSLLLPLEVGNKQKVTPLPHLVPAARDYRDVHILVIEDNPMSQLVLSKFLKELHCSISLANDGAEGLEKALKEKPDIIFLDTHMPVLSGLDTLKAIRESAVLQNIPVVAVSGDAFKESIDEVMLAGANDYITKPVEFRQLHSVLDKYF